MRKTQHDLAKQFGVHERTIRTWEKEDAPLGDPGAMTEWIQDRRRNNGAFGGAEPLPPGCEHTNLVRMLVEEAARHFFYHAFHASFDTLVEGEIETGRTPEQARGNAFLFYFGMGCRLKEWTQGDMFNDWLKEQGQSLDEAMKLLRSDWKGRSRPPGIFRLQPIPPPVQAAMKTMGLPPMEAWDFTMKKDEDAPSTKKAGARKTKRPGK